MCIEIVQLCFKNADSDSVDLRWGPNFCIPNNLPVDADADADATGRMFAFRAAKFKESLKKKISILKKTLVKGIS